MILRIGWRVGDWRATASGSKNGNALKASCKLILDGMISRVAPGWSPKCFRGYKDMGTYFHTRYSMLKPPDCGEMWPCPSLSAPFDPYLYALQCLIVLILLWTEFSIALIIYIIIVLYLHEHDRDLLALTYGIYWRKSRSLILTYLIMILCVPYVSL